MNKKQNKLASSEKSRQSSYHILFITIRQNTIHSKDTLTTLILFKKWYVSWMCMSMWPFWLAGQQVPVCPSVCSQVQEHCPFNIILDDASTASGDPTFICQGNVHSQVSILQVTQQNYRIFYTLAIRYQGNPEGMQKDKYLYKQFSFR